MKLNKLMWLFNIHTGGLLINPNNFIVKLDIMKRIVSLVRLD